MLLVYVYFPSQLPWMPSSGLVLMLAVLSTAQQYKLFLNQSCTLQQQPGEDPASLSLPAGGGVVLSW